MGFGWPQPLRTTDTHNASLACSRVQAVVLRGFFVLLVFGGVSSLQAQQLRWLPETALLRQAAQAHNPLVLRRPAAPVYDVIALRVEFQPDTTRFTTGDGLFDGVLFEDLEPVVDPLPHDADYFEAHLMFLRHYVARVSDGKTALRTHVLPEVVQVSQPMSAYSPTGFEADSDAELVKLASLIQEAWTLASDQTTFDIGTLNPATTAFVLFHAGVGRDIELIGTTLDKTPEDLPSIYFDGNALRRLLGENPISYKGVKVNHTILLPRTETRQGFDFIQDANFLAEFSINGLLAASFFNYLGVPDLFNVETGESAIGPFGLMDPLGLFAFRGLFPPEPSAWTKLYLGWTDPMDISGHEAQEIALNAASFPGESDVARVWVSDAEYFLVENRFRDPEADGLTMQIWKDGAITEQVVQNGDEEFNALVIDGFQGGVVVSVDNYDWALPGGLDEDDNPLNGGLLVWHVDERRLADGLAGSGVNIDSEHRSIDVEEADGAQDLGFPSGNVLGPEFDLGTPFDFFYEGNPVSVITLSGQEVSLYQNRFGPDTYPNSNTNAGGPSFVTLTDFTAPAPQMQFRYEVTSSEAVSSLPEVLLGDEVVQTVAGSALRMLPDGETLAFRVGITELIVGDQTGPVRIRVGGDAVSNPVAFADGRLAWLERVGGEVRLTVASADLTQQGHQTLTLGGERWVVEESGLLARDSTLWLLIREESATQLWRADFVGGTQIGAVAPLDVGLANPASLVGLPDAGIGVFSAEGAAFNPSGALSQNWSYRADAVGQGVVGRDASGVWGAVTAPAEQKLWLLQPDERVQAVDLSRWAMANDVATAYPIMVDLDNDNQLEVVVTMGTNLLAFNQTGALADGFPIEMSASVSTQPLVASFTEEGSLALITGATNGAIYAYDMRRPGHQVEEFPLAVGKSMVTTPVLAGDRLFAIAETGRLRGWSLTNMSNIIWGQQGSDAANTNASDIGTNIVLPSGGAGLLVKADTYNWPNPIQNGETNIRITPTQTSRVVITIIDQAGALVDKLEIDEARAGIATEVVWQTDAPSGVYFARIHARAADGTSDDYLIRMAIVR